MVSPNRLLIPKPSYRNLWQTYLLLRKFEHFLSPEKHVEVFSFRRYDGTYKRIVFYLNDRP